jgi:CHAT domain-containing protein/tetratricopeptide (TPR) repeat protein
VTRRGRAALLLLVLSLTAVAACGEGLRGRDHPARATSGTSGFLDHFTTDVPHSLLERLVFEDRYVEAFNQAVSSLRERAARVGFMHPDTLAALQWVAGIAAMGGDRRTADELFDALLSIRSRRLSADDPLLAETLLRRSRAARTLDDFETARLCFEQARAILAARPDDDLTAFLHQTEAALNLRSDLEAASNAYRRALGILTSLRQSPDPSLATIHAWLAWTLDRLARPEEAASHLVEARRQLGSLGLQGIGLDATLQQLQADQEAFQGRWDTAEPLYRAAAESNVSRRYRTLGGFARRSPLDGFEELALAAVLRDDTDRAWTLLQTGRAATYRDFAALGLWKQRSPEDLDEARAARRELLKVVRLVERAKRLGLGPWDESTWRLSLEALQLRSRLTTLEARYLETHRPGQPSLREVQSFLDSRTAIVGWLEVNIGGAVSGASRPRRSWGLLYVIRDTGRVRWVKLWEGVMPPEAAAPPFTWGFVTGALRRAAEWPARVEPDPALDRHLRDWTERYFDPALPHLEGIDRLIVEGAKLPLDIHRDDRGRFLVDRFDITYAPSASFLSLVEARARRRPVTNPVAVLSLSASAGSLGSNDLIRLVIDDERRVLRPSRTSFPRRQMALADLPHLPFAGLEAEAVARRFPIVTLLKGGENVERELRNLGEQDRLSGFDVIHVAGHTLFDAAAERCGLAIHEGASAADRIDDGVLDAEEILLGWDLDGALLTLSGCESAHAAGVWRGEDLGLTPALFAAGAGRVIVSLWSVDDRATAVLMDRLYANLVGDGRLRRLPPAAALREAKIHVRTLADAAGRRPFEHPAYWAGFVLIGPPDPSAAEESSGRPTAAARRRPDR